MRARVGRYRIVRQLGMGGMGEVYLARDSDLDRFVAVKLLRDAGADDPHARARFRREARALAALNHPGIVTVYEIGQDEGHDFIAMEYLSGRPLRLVLDLLRARKGEPSREFDFEWLGEMLVAAERREEIDALLALWGEEMKEGAPDRRSTAGVHAARVLDLPDLATSDAFSWSTRTAGDAVLAEMRGDHAAAIALWRTLLADPSEYGDHLIRLALARNLHASGDTAGLRVACDDIAHPRVWRSDVIPAVHACRRWTAR